MKTKTSSLAKLCIAFRFLCIILASVMVVAGFTNWFTFKFNWAEAPGTCTVDIIMGVVWLLLVCFHSYELRGDFEELAFIKDLEDKIKNED